MSSAPERTGLAPKHQRLVLVILATLALVGAALLAAWGLRNQASFYYLPSEVAAAAPQPGQAIRIGGMVEEGSLKIAADGVTVTFVVGDGKARIPMRYSGIVPDLFTEGSGVTADGHFDENGVFIADELLAKHDENYVPRELQDMTSEQAHKVLEEAE